jgi:tetratricopeptide (TPR) repeat protein
MKRSNRFDLGRIPVSGPHFVGREAELARLDHAWESPGTHVLTLVAFGGFGKTALVSRWIDRLINSGWRGTERALFWTFSSQGTENRVASAESFLDYALYFFGDGKRFSGSPHERGFRLAERVRGQRSLLVLDGVESLQYPTGPLEGELKDPGLRALLKGLASANPGLCIITTRKWIADLNSFELSAPQVRLEELSIEAGVTLLRKLGVDGRVNELRAAVKDTRGHALTLTLLGNYLHKACESDVRRRHEIGLSKADEREGGRAFRVIKAYADWLGEGPELAILRLLGLFDRPADAKALAALRAAPPIPNLTEPLIGLPEEDWQLALTNLRGHGLLAAIEGKEAGNLDAHPLVRAYFGEDLQKRRREAWKAGHQRLYDYLCKTAPDKPDSLEAMQPLFQAVVHGCRAGKPQEALDDIYDPRIRKEEKFRASGAALIALASFFEHPWDRLASGLTPDAQAFVLNQAGMELRNLGRLREAVEPLDQSMKAYSKLQDEDSAAKVAENLSELTLTLGNVRDAFELGKTSVKLADQSGSQERRLVSRARLADAFHQAGQSDGSAEVFREAEEIQKRTTPSRPLLHGLRGYQYCDLLLSQAEPVDGSKLGGLGASPAESSQYRQACSEVLDRVKQTLEWSKKVDFDHALGLLILGQAELGLALTAAQSILSKSDGSLDRAEEYLDQGVKLIRQTAQDGHLPRALLARATLQLYRPDFQKAEIDLVEALEIAEAGSMRLHACDAQYGLARLHLLQGDAEAATSHLLKARALVTETGYRRRERNVTYLEQQLAALPKLSTPAPDVDITDSAPHIETKREARVEASAQEPQRPTVFISYSQKNERWKERLFRQLQVLELEKVLVIWHDKQISAGDDWLAEITAAMERARVAVLLVSADFMTSNFIRRLEVPLLLQRRKDEGLRVIPLLVEPCPWLEVDWLAPMKCRPENGKFLSGLKTHRADVELANLAKEIRDLLKNE